MNINKSGNTSDSLTVCTCRKLHSYCSVQRGPKK